MDEALDDEVLGLGVEATLPGAAVVGALGAFDVLNGAPTAVLCEPVPRRPESSAIAVTMSSSGAAHKRQPCRARSRASNSAAGDWPGRP